MVNTKGRLVVAKTQNSNTKGQIPDNKAAKCYTKPPDVPTKEAMPHNHAPKCDSNRAELNIKAGKMNGKGANKNKNQRLAFTKHPLAFAKTVHFDKKAAVLKDMLFD